MRPYAAYLPTNVDWMPAIPAHWEVRPLGLAGEVINGHPFDSKQFDASAGYPLVRIRDIYSDVAETHFNGDWVDTAAIDTNDVLIGMDGDFNVAIWRGGKALLNQRVCCVRTARPTLSRYLSYVLPIPLRKTNELTYATTVKHLSSFDVLKYRVPVPPSNEVDAIASYLDAETARIDALVEEKEKCVELLTESRASVITEMTAGRDIAGLRVETGSPFMPSIPASWAYVPIKRYAQITNGSTPLKENADYWSGGAYPWLNSSVVNFDEVMEGSEFVTETALRRCHLPIVPPGNVVVALTGQGKTRGQASMLRIEATINQHLAAIIVDQEILDGEYLFWVLNGQYAALRMVSDGQGGTKGALTCEELGRFPVPLPPLRKQKAIAARLYEETGRIDELIGHVRRELELLAELRSSTITDAVLGRIDVRDHRTR